MKNPEAVIRNGAEQLALILGMQAAIDNHAEDVVAAEKLNRQLTRIRLHQPFGWTISFKHDWADPLDADEYLKPPIEYKLPDDVKIREVHIIQPTSFLGYVIARTGLKKFPQGYPADFLLKSDELFVDDSGKLRKSPPADDDTWPLYGDALRRSKRQRFIQTNFPLTAIVHGSLEAPESPIIVPETWDRPGALIDNLINGRCLPEQLKTPVTIEDPQTALEQVKGLIRHIKDNGTPVPSRG